jgi:integrase
VEGPKKMFFWQKFVRGRPVWRKIGPYPDLSVEQARGKAAELNGQLAKSNAFGGPHPFSKHDPGSLTFALAFERYIEGHIRKKKSAHPGKAEKTIRRIKDVYLRSLEDRLLTEISRETMNALHARIGEKHGRTMANRAIEFTKATYNFAERTGLWSGSNPCRGITKYDEEPRDRRLSKSELERLFKALSESGNRDLQDFVGLLFSTASRKSPVLAMLWGKIEGDVWHLTGGKGDTKYDIPLTPEAMKILERRRRHAEEGAVWVFPATSASGHTTDLERSWRAVLKAAGIENFHAHDIRHCIASTVGDQGGSDKAIDTVLGHDTRKSNLARRYSGLLNLAAHRKVLERAVKEIFKSA